MKLILIFWVFATVITFLRFSLELKEINAKEVLILLLESIISFPLIIICFLGVIVHAVKIRKIDKAIDKIIEYIFELHDKVEKRIRGNR